MSTTVSPLAHLGHAELLTPELEASRVYFEDLLGMVQVARSDKSIYLRALGDYERYSLKLTAAAEPGIAHTALRMSSQEALNTKVAWLESQGAGLGWADPDEGKGPAYRFQDPDGHEFRIYYQTKRYSAPTPLRAAMKTSPQAYRGRGANVRRLEHCNLLANDVAACRQFMGREGLGLRTYEIIRLDSGRELGAWMSATIQGHEIIYVQEAQQARGRLHHLAFYLDSREDVLKAADLFDDAGVFIEAGPSRHTAIQSFYLYTIEPGGNRIEVTSGGYLVFDPDDAPAVWSEQEWAQKPGWGAVLPQRFHSYGTPIVDESSEHHTVSQQQT